MLTEELEPAQGSVYCGDIFLLSAASTLQSAGCVLDCKAGQSLCDLFTSMGAALAASPLQLPAAATATAGQPRTRAKGYEMTTRQNSGSSREEILRRALHAFVNIDTCSVRWLVYFYSMLAIAC
jgi:hypothetical protein